MFLQLFLAITLFMVTDSNQEGLLGNWTNIDTRADGLTRILITQEGIEWKVQAWIKGIKESHYLGKVDFKPARASRDENSPNYGFATWEMTFGTVNLSFKIAGQQLIIEEYILYKKGYESDRGNVRSLYTMQRVSRPALKDLNEPAFESPTWGWTIVGSGKSDDYGCCRGQSFIAKDPFISSVEVGLFNKKVGSDMVTMKIWSEDGKMLTKQSKNLDKEFDDWLLFEIPGSGLKVEPGQKLILTLEEMNKLYFGWKYSRDGYPDGMAIFNDKKEEPPYDFLFRINHAKTQKSLSIQPSKETEKEPSQPKTAASETTRSSTAEEVKWWQELQAAGRDAAAAYERKDRAIAEVRRSRSAKDEKDLLPRKELEKMNADINGSTQRFKALMQEGREKSYRAPAPDVSPTLLHKVRAEYTGEAREKKIVGKIVLMAEFLADGTIGEVKVIKGLGHGLDENATEAARGFLFIPAIRDGLFAPTRARLEFTFDLL